MLSTSQWQRKPQVLSWLATDWLCVGAEQVVLKVIVLLSIEDLWSDWSLAQTSGLLVLWDGEKRREKTLNLTGSVA